MLLYQKNGIPRRSRTYNLFLRTELLYPIELAGRLTIVSLSTLVVLAVHDFFAAKRVVANRFTVKPEFDFMFSLFWVFTSVE